MKCEYTDAEITDLAKDLARANNTKDALEQQKKEVDSQLKADITAQESTISRLSRLISNGFEMRNVEVRIELDTPEAGKKRIVRLHTGEEVAIKNMTDQDRQMVIDLQSAADAQEAKAEPIVTPPPYQQRIDAPVSVTMTGSDGEVLFNGTDKEFHEAAASGATLGPAVLHGGTRQSKKRKRNADAEGYADGSAEG